MRHISDSHLAALPQPLTGVVLAGGRGSRLGGRDKGLLVKDGQAFVAHIVSALTPQVDDCLINANRHIDEYQHFGPVISDELAEFQGPLAGMLAAMRHCRAGWIVTLPCDGIEVADDYVARLARALANSGQPIAVAHDGQRLQPVHALIPCHLQASLEAFLATGDRKIDRWYAAESFAQADFSDCPEIFRNINTPEQQREFKAE